MPTIHGWSSPSYGQLRRADLVAESHLRERQVDAGERLDAPTDVLGVRADVAAEGAEDALDLALLLELRLAPAVGHVDDGERLEPHRGAAAGDVVDDALELAAHVGLDGDDVSAVAQGDDGLLRNALGERRREDVLEPLVQAVVEAADLAADAAEGGAGLVGDLAALVDAAVDGLDDARLRRDGVDRLGEQGERLIEPRDRRAEVAGALERRGDVEQLRRIEDAAAGALLGGGTDVVGAAEAGARLQLEEAARLGGLALAADDLAMLRRRLERLGERSAGGKRRMSREPRDDLVVLQSAECVGVHVRECNDWARSQAAAWRGGSDSS